jgi:DNA repair exonuclease SbcCD ATPase subunit
MGRGGGGKDTVFQKRLNGEREEELACETMRSSAESSGPGQTERRDDEGMSLFWRVFGGTILSIVALGSITLYNSISTNISELRGELNREREARAELVKKDEFNSRMSSQYERMRSFEGLKAEHEAVKERLNANAALLEGVKKDAAATTDTVKKDAAALEVLKERLTALEAVKKDIAGLDLVKERLAAIAAEIKAQRDDVTKVQHEVERNKAGDVERKTSRDAQFKQMEDALKELQKGLQACREKLARLEGAQPGGSSRESPAPGPPSRGGKSGPPHDNDE